MKKQNILFAIGLTAIFLPAKPYKLCIVNEAKNTWEAVTIYDDRGNTLSSVGSISAGKSTKVDIAANAGVRFISSLHKSRNTGNKELFFTDSRLNADARQRDQTWKFKGDDTSRGIDIDSVPGCSQSVLK